MNGRLLFLLSVFLCLGSGWLMAGEMSKKTGGKEKKATPRYTIGKDTTYITGPKDKDGYLDHAAALNAILGKGVTTETNANVLLWKALGPKPEGGAPMPKEFFKLMGIEPLPEKGEYFLDLFRFAREKLKLDTMARQKELLDEMDATREGPWTAPQHPIVAKWLAANEDVLMLVTEACQREHYFSPLTPRDRDGKRDALVASLLPGVQKCREMCGALVTRAMLRMGEGKYEEAWQDLLTCHRLGRHVAKGGTLIEGLVGIAIDHIASHADLIFLDRTRLDAKKPRACLADLQKLPPMPPIAEKIDVTERFIVLDLAVMVDRYGIDRARELGPLIGFEDLSLLPKDLLDSIDWNVALRRVNHWYDRLAGAMADKDRALRNKRLDEINRDIAAVRAKLTDLGTLLTLLDDKKGNRETRGQLMADALVTVMIPSVAKVNQAFDRNIQTERNLRVAFALAAHRAEKGEYPRKLEDLTPAYFKEVPGDFFTGKSLKYLTAEGGYLLYSFGPNEMDDRGRWYDDEPPGDDPRVRMPLPKRKD